jgi:hypothetical protein
MIFCWTGTYGHQLVGKSFGIFIGSFIKGLGFHGR